MGLNDTTLNDPNVGIRDDAHVDAPLKSDATTFGVTFFVTQTIATAGGPAVLDAVTNPYPGMGGGPGFGNPSPLLIFQKGDCTVNSHLNSTLCR